MLVRNLLSLGNRQLSSRPLQHAKYYSQEPLANWFGPNLVKVPLPCKPSRLSLTQKASLTSICDKHAHPSEQLKPLRQQDAGVPLAAPHPSLPSSQFRLHSTGPLSNLGLLAKVTPLSLQQMRCFHAKGSKVRYLDFRYKFNTSNLRSHLLIVRRQKMKKHRRQKWRKKFKTVLAKMRLKREIAKEKAFRVELLTMIRRAEQFDPREYALRKIAELNNRPKPASRGEKYEELKELIRTNRYQVTYIKPKHRRAES